MHCHRAVRQIVLVAVALVVSCDRSTAPRSTVPVASVTVSPAVASIALGQTVQLTATPRDSQGNGLAGRAVAWSPSDASVATVRGRGLGTAEGGDEVSLPYRGATRAVLVHGGAYWLVDFTPGVGVSNGRQLSGNLAPVQDQAFAFSTNPATPWYAYVSNGTSVRRLDIRTMTEAAGDGWPVNNEPVAVWLQQSENDGLFAWMRGASGPTVAGYEPATGTLKTYTSTGIG